MPRLTIICPVESRLVRRARAITAAALKSVQKAVLARMVQFAHVIERGHSVKFVHLLLVTEFVECHFSSPLSDGIGAFNVVMDYGQCFGQHCHYATFHGHGRRHRAVLNWTKGQPRRRSGDKALTDFDGAASARARDDVPLAAGMPLN